eukprot:EG_transcript_15283
MDPVLRVVGQRNGFTPGTPKGGASSPAPVASLAVGRAGLSAALNALKQPSKVEERLSIVKKGRQRKGSEGDIPAMAEGEASVNIISMGSSWNRLQDHISPPKTPKDAEGEKTVTSSKTVLIGLKGRASSLARLMEKAEVRRPTELEYLRRASDSDVLRRASELEAIRVLSPQEPGSATSVSPRSELDLNISLSITSRSVMSAPGVGAIADSTVPGCIPYPIMEDPDPDDLAAVDDLIEGLLAEAFVASPSRHLTAHMALHLPVTPRETRLSPRTIDPPRVSPRLSPKTQRGGTALPLFSPR